MGRYPGAPESDASGSSVVTGGLSLVGRHTFAYSGTVTVTNTETDLITGTSGPEYIICTVQFNHEEAGSNDYKYRVRLNDDIAQSYIVTGSAGSSEPDNGLTVLIPPFTRVRCTAQNVSGGVTGHRQTASLVGKLYVTRDE